MRGLKLGSVAVAFVAALTLAACGGDDEADEQEPETVGAAVPEETPEPVAEEPPADEPAPEVAGVDVAADGPGAAVADDPAPPAEEVIAEEAPAEEVAPEQPPAQEPVLGAADEAAADETPEPAEAAAGGPEDDGGLIVGTAEAIESATLMVDGTRVMLYGLESVYPPQICYIGGEPWECWAAAVRQLQTILSDGPVECTPMAPPDYIRRELALCEINGESLNERYIRSGFALAIEDEMPEYAAIEEAARAEGIGLWQGQFQEPHDFRLSRGITARRP